MRDPYIRLVESEADIKAIWEIWMQKHVLPYMSFEKMPFDKFKLEVYEKLAKESHIYAMIDKIDGKEQIVAVRRLKFENGTRRHTAGYYSFAVDERYRGRGYGRIFYELFKKELDKHPYISRIEFTQSGGNVVAFHLSDEFGFKKEALFPGWLYRKAPNGVGKYNLPERYVSLIVDKTVMKKISNKNLIFDLKIPNNSNSKIPYKIKQSNNHYEFYLDDEIIATCSVEIGSSVINHIAFLSLEIKQSNKQQKITACLRDLTLQLQKQYSLKKIEIFTHDKSVLTILQNLGYHYRGEKIASLKIGENYFNEAGADFGFFNIDDAKSLLQALDLSDEKNKTLNDFLKQCQDAIQQALNKNEIDTYMTCYCENLAYQMTHDTHSPHAIYSAENAPWTQLILSLPQDLKTSFEALLKQLGNHQSSTTPKPPKFFKMRQTNHRFRRQICSPLTPTSD